jgi:phosphatidylserine/phosphatidylglycerophosphate/cardiolipin synthase-like enzyme
VRLLLFKKHMAEFLDTTATSYYLEKLIKSAQERLMLISPYFKLNPRIRQLIDDATRQEMDIRIVYGKKEQNEEITRLRLLKNIQITFCKNLHAKCYLNEETCIVTSLNLYEFSQANNQEMGVLFRKSSDPELYGSVCDEAERIVRISGGHLMEAPKSEAALAVCVKEKAGTFDKLSTSNLAKKLGFQTRALTDKLIGRGYLELREGDKHYLTPKGKSAGGEFRFSKGPFFLWPVDLEI